MQLKVQLKNFDEFFPTTVNLNALKDNLKIQNGVKRNKLGCRSVVFFFFDRKLTLLYQKKYIVVLQSGMDYVRDMCVGVVCPMTVSLLVLCEDVGVSFSSEASKLAVVLQIK